MGTVPPETPLEVASGLVCGGDPLPPRPGVGPRPGAALAALGTAVLPALLRPPCVVTFSGGTDSSLVLAVATRTARRHGLADPVPFTWRFPDVPATDEATWQHAVVDPLRLREWVVATAEPDELDLVGPRARPVLLRHGVRHPVNLHLHAAPLELARGGSLLTGAGGDQVLSGWRRPENRTGARQLKDRVPPALRVRLRRLAARDLPWLDPAAARSALADRMREEAAEPVGTADRVRWHAGRRELVLSLANLRALGAPHDVLVGSPLAEPGFVHALAHEVGDRPAPRRSALVGALAGDAVPAAVWQPRRKARFGDVFLGAHSRSLAREWDGRGVDPALVDVAALRRAWTGTRVPLATAGLLQQVFLATRPAGPAAPDTRDDADIYDDADTHDDADTPDEEEQRWATTRTS